jgi:dynein heavy chain
LTIVLFQEIDKYNSLITKIENSLEDVKKAIDGAILMSNEGDEIFNSLLINKIPLSFSKISYSSNKPLGSWFDDLSKRVEFIRSWMTANSHPNSYWLSGFFFPQGFITGVYQNHARETKIPVSDITIKFSVIDKKKEEITKGPSVIYLNLYY